MSVLMASKKAFERIFVKAVDYTFHKTCDINYCSTLFRLNEHQIKDFILTLCNLNEESYNVRYKQPTEIVKLSDFLNLNFSGETINTYQMLKSLQMIEYNIEVCTIETVRKLNEKEINAVKKLRCTISELQGVIINELPEYQQAEYNL